MQLAEIQFSTIGHYTKEQTVRAFSDWQCSEPLPRKGLCVVINCANPRSVIRVTKSEHKSTYGKALYRIEYSAQV